MNPAQFFGKSKARVVCRPASVESDDSELSEGDISGDDQEVHDPASKEGSEI